MPTHSSSSRATELYEIVEFRNARLQRRTDGVVVEEPMEIRLLHGPAEQRSVRSISITMRTPGDDHELAAGFLFTESIITSPQQIEMIESRGVDPSGTATGNIVRVTLRPEVSVEVKQLQRHFFTTSSCGVCGKASLDMLEVKGLQSLASNWQAPAQTICQLPDRLRSAQPTFSATGGVHAAGLVDRSGELRVVREDVGRHNAVDKVIGRAFLDHQTPLGDHWLAISGRASFEIMQKALVAGISLIVAVGAPSSLAIELAKRYNITLVGFASNQRFNVYAGWDRVV